MADSGQTPIAAINDATSPCTFAGNFNAIVTGTFSGTLRLEVRTPGEAFFQSTGKEWTAAQSPAYEHTNTNPTLEWRIRAVVWASGTAYVRIVGG